MSIYRGQGSLAHSRMLLHMHDLAQISTEARMYTNMLCSHKHTLCHTHHESKLECNIATQHIENCFMEVFMHMADCNDDHRQMLVVETQNSK